MPKQRASARRDQAVFNRARLQLTAWYALILALIVLIFSGLLYGVAAFRFGGYRHEQEPAAERRIEHETTAFALGELRAYLLLGNVALLALGVGGAYWLAGRTLQPIARAMARQDRFTTDASHELRTPLTAIRGAVDVALRRERPPADYRAVLQEVNAEIEAITGLIEQLLWLARGGPNGRPEALDPRAILEEVVRKTAVISAERGSTVHLEPGSPGTVALDPTTLRQVLLNLITNALQHTPPGSAVRMCVEREGLGIALSISDNGPGIPTEERANVLQPFYRLRTTSSDGHGLGLALTHELVAASGGTIRIEETPGGGTTVVVWFPQVITAAKPFVVRAWRSRKLWKGGEG